MSAGKYQVRLESRLNTIIYVVYDIVTNEKICTFAVKDTAKRYAATLNGEAK